MSAAELRVRDLSHAVAGRLLLDNITLTASAGRSLTVMGPSGSGKTTLLMLMAGTEAPSRGKVDLDGVATTTVRRERFGIVLQNYGLVSELTAAENVALPLQVRAMPRHVVAARALAALNAVGLGRFGDHLVDELSGGQQQRVALARALVGEPEVVIADEPSSEQDAEHRLAIIRLLQGESRRGKIVVVASHDPEIAAATDRQVWLVGGRIVED